MRSVILVGSSESALKFIDNFVEEKKIEASNINVYMKLAIGEVREIRRQLARRINGSRLFFIDGRITLEAQHALLKSLEELPSDTYFILRLDRRSEVINTITSRCNVIMLPIVPTERNPEVRDLLFAHLHKPSVSTAFSASSLIIKKEVSDLEFLFLLSDFIRENLLEKNETDPSVSIAISLFDQYLVLLPLFQNNNLNRKMALETAFLQSSNLVLDK